MQHKKQQRRRHNVSLQVFAIKYDTERRDIPQILLKQSQGWLHQPAMVRWHSDCYLMRPESPSSSVQVYFIHSECHPGGGRWCQHTRVGVGAGAGLQEEQSGITRSLGKSGGRPESSNSAPRYKYCIIWMDSLVAQSCQGPEGQRSCTVALNKLTLSWYLLLSMSRNSFSLKANENSPDLCKPSICTHHGL